MMETIPFEDSMKLDQGFTKENHNALFECLKYLTEIGYGTGRNRLDMQERTYSDLEKLFCMRSWWRMDYLEYKLRTEINPVSQNHSSNSRTENRACEEGFILELKNLVRKTHNKEYISVQSFIQDMWKLLDGYARRPTYDARSDRNANLVCDISNGLWQIGRMERLKRELKICCAECRLSPHRHVACKGKDCMNMVEINSPCYVSYTERQNGYCREQTQIIICTHCFDNPVHDKVVHVKIWNVGPNKTTWMLKALDKNSFRKTTWNFDFAEWEPIITCHSCNFDYHRICTKYDEFNMTHIVERAVPGFSKSFCVKFICIYCIQRFKYIFLQRYGYNSILRRNLIQLSSSPSSVSVKTQVFSEKSFRHTALSNFMETELQEWLYRRFSIQKEEPLPPDIKVRVLCSRKKILEAKPRMKKEFLSQNSKTSWEYQYKSIMVFQKNPEPDSDEYVAVFNMIVHEYPSQSRVNLSYIDSVKLFHPVHLRKDFYRRIVFTYLQYLQKYKSFKTLHFWVCPPKAGDEYVFYGRPPPAAEYRRKTNFSGLIGWYQTLMGTCLEEGIISEYYQNTGDKNPYKDVTDVPYMADDFWVDRLEKLLEDHERETEALKSGTWDKRSPRGKKPRKTFLSLNERFDEVVKTDNLNLLFTATFSPVDIKMDVKSENEPNEECDIYSLYMASRDNFLIDCRERKYDFYDRRRATYSTMFLFSKLAQESLKLQCCICRKNIQDGWYCKHCNKVIFCSEDCCKRHEVHVSTSSSSGTFVPFVVPLDNPIMTTDTMSEAQKTFGLFLATVFETDFQCLSDLNSQLFGVRPNFCRLWSTNMCPTFLYILANLNAKENILCFYQRNFEHIRGCLCCYPLYLLHQRHWSVCSARTCTLACCSVGNKSFPVPAWFVDHADFSSQVPVQNLQQFNVTVSNSENNYSNDDDEANMVVPNTRKRRAHPVDPNCRPRKRTVERADSESVSDESQITEEIQEASNVFESLQRNGMIQIQNNHVVNRNGKIKPTRLIDMAVQNGFTPLTNYSDPSTSLSSQLPFTRSLQAVIRPSESADLDTDDDDDSDQDDDDDMDTESQS